MAEIPIKPFSRNTVLSLAWRVLYGSLLLLGLPLLIHTFFLYRREYRENVQDTFQSLQYLTEGRTLYFEEMVRNQENVLRAIESELPSSVDARKAFLVQEASEYQFDAFIYIQWIDGQPVCEESLCSDPTFFPFLEKAREHEFFVFVNPHACEACLYVSKSLPGALLLIKTDLQPLFIRLAHFENSTSVMRLSLINASNQILFSTQSIEISSWVPYTQLSNAWMFKSKEEMFLAVKRPIQGTNYMLLLDVPRKNIAELQLKDYVFRIASFFFLVCLLGGAILFWFTQRIAKPLRALGDCMQRVAEGATHVRFKKDRMGFEINTLGLYLNQMLDALFEASQEAERERIARERLAQELRIGHQIQASMLPVDLPNEPSLEIAPGYLAAREVSGDFYDLFILEDGRLLIAIADGADKGITACLYSLSFRSMLRAVATTQDDLASILSVSNALLLRDTAATSFFITAWIGLYDPKTRQLSYCSQGHPPTYLQKKNGKLEELSTQGIALGLQEIQPQIKHLILDHQDLLVLYTDGIIEAHDSSGQFFGKKRLKELIQNCKQKDAATTLEQLLKQVSLFCKDAPQADDLTVVIIRVK